MERENDEAAPVKSAQPGAKSTEQKEPSLKERVKATIDATKARMRSRQLRSLLGGRAPVDV